MKTEEWGEAKEPDFFFLLTANTVNKCWALSPLTINHFPVIQDTAHQVPGVVPDSFECRTFHTQPSSWPVQGINPSSLMISNRTWAKLKFQFFVVVFFLKRSYHVAVCSSVRYLQSTKNVITLRLRSCSQSCGWSRYCVSGLFRPKFCRIGRSWVIASIFTYVTVPLRGHFYFFFTCCCTTTAAICIGSLRSRTQTLKTLRKTCAQSYTHVSFHLTQLKRSAMSGNTCAFRNVKETKKVNRESCAGTKYTKKERAEWEEGKRGSTVMLLRSNLWSLCICIQNLQSPSAHIISSVLVTSTKTKRSRMLQMYYVGGIIKSNPSPSQLYLPKDAGQSCIHHWGVCVSVCVCTLRHFAIYCLKCTAHQNTSLNILAP